MAQSLELLSRDREESLARAREDRELQERQQRWVMLADDYHEQIRLAAAALTRKQIAFDLGVDLSTVSNWLSCEPGRGLPTPRLLLYLRRKHPQLAAWERENAEVPADDSELLDEIERDVLQDLSKRDQEKFRALLRRRRRSGR